MQTLLQSISLGILIFLVVPARANSQQSSDFEQTIAEAFTSLTKNLRSGTCIGNLKLSYQAPEGEREEPLVDYDFRLSFRGKKFRFERSFRLNKLSQDHPVCGWKGEADGSVRQVLIVDGSDQSLWVKYDANNALLGCMALNKNWTKRLLSNQDFPAPHPARPWDNTLVALELGLKWKQVPIRGGGVLGKGETKEMEGTIYLLAPPPLKLSRFVATAKESAVIEELNGYHDQYTLNWAQSNGIDFVESYSRRIFVNHPNAMLKRYTKEVHYKSFQANVEIPDSDFDIRSLELAEGTEFKVNAPVPHSLYFDGETLVRSPAK